MSLVHQMLKDLEKRGAGPALVVPPRPHFPQHTNRHKKNAILFLLITLASMIFVVDIDVIASAHHRKKIHRPAVRAAVIMPQKKLPPVTAAAPVAAVAPPAPVPPAAPKPVPVMQTTAPVTALSPVTQENSPVKISTLPDATDEAYERAVSLMKDGKPQAALTLLELHAPGIDIKPEYYAFMAALYQRENQPQMAASLYRQLLTLDPYKGIWWIGLAIALESSERHAEAQMAYARAARDETLSPALRAYVDSEMHG